MKSPKWLLLAHQLPATPSKNRVKLWRRLQALGAVPLKNSLHVLPDVEGAREDLEWLCKEIAQAKGTSQVFAADSVDDADNEEIVRTFRKARAEDFARLAEAARALAEDTKSAISGGYVREALFDKLRKRAAGLKADQERLRKVDFFGAPNRRGADAAADAAQEAFQRLTGLSGAIPPAPPPAVSARAYARRVWVTRPSPHIDRLASAWLVRRFIDRDARFKFAEEPYAPEAGEVRFDMADAEFTHHGDWCTLETLAHRFRLGSPALVRLEQIVHDIDLKDEKFSRPEASGIALAVRGICRGHAADAARLEAGITFFDGLYEALKEETKR